MTPSLSILCVTRNEPHAHPFLCRMSELAWRCRAQFVVALDGVNRVASNENILRRVRPDILREVRSEGYLESVLEEAVVGCAGDYILRLDDDERCSWAMCEWVESRAWTHEPSWAFATAGLWGDKWSVLVMPEFWPQYHTRLSRKELSGGRKRIHAPSPYGRGAIAPVILEHHKFLVKSLAERQVIAERYDRIKHGSGKRCHSTPELVYDEFWLAPLGDGRLRTWSADEVRRIPVQRPPHV